MARAPASTAPNIYGGAAGRAANRQRLRESARARVEAGLRLRAPQLFADAADLEVPAEEVKALSSWISSKFHSDEMAVACNYLAELLRRGVEKRNWKVQAYPPQVVNVRRRASPFRPETFARSVILSEIIRRHERVLVDASVDLFPTDTGSRASNKADRWNRPLQPLPPLELQAAQLMFSSIVFGGLIERHLIYKLPTALETSLFTHGNCIWVEFMMSDEASPERQLYRRWFPDPVSSCLILRWRLRAEPWPAPTPAAIRKLLKRYLRRLGVYYSGGQKPNPSGKTAPLTRLGFERVDARVFEGQPAFAQVSPFEFLLDAAETRLQTGVPSVLVGFARSLRAGVSLAPEVWWRTLKDERIVNSAGGSPESGTGISSELLDIVEAWPDAPREAALKPKPSIQQQLYREVRTCFYKKGRNVRPAETRHAIETLLKKRGSEFGPMLMCITAWASWCLTARTQGKGALKVRSVLRYLTSVAQKLIDYAGDMNPKDMSAEEFHNLFDRIGSAIHAPHERQYARERLSEFHEYLVATLGIPELDSGSKLGHGGNDSAPDANLITEAEFCAVLKQLRSWVPDQRKSDMLVNATTMAYRLGLRRNELAGLQLISVQGIKRGGLITSRPLIWVRASSYSSVKTHASTRRLPLFELLSATELERLVNWVKRRYQEDGATAGSIGLLFCEPGRSSTKLDDFGGFRLITDAARAVTGDSTVRFHHFRHSFITLLVARLLAATESTWGTAALPKTWVGPTGLAGPALVRRLFANDQPTRKAIYQVSAVAGHIDPEETIQTYCHSLDWLLGRYLLHADRPVSLKLLSAIDGRSPTAVAVDRHRSGGDPRKLGTDDIRRSLGRLIRKARRTKPRVFAAPPKSKPRINTPVNQQVLSERKLCKLTLDEAYALAFSSRRNISQASRAALFHLSALDIANFISEATRIATIQTRTRVKGRRRPRFLRYQPVRPRAPRSAHRREILSVGPALPRVEAELTEARRIFNRLVAFPEGERPAVIQRLECLLRVGSRTESALYVSSESDLMLLGGLLRDTGIGASRIGVRVLSLPEGSPSKRDFVEQVTQLLHVPKRAVSFDSHGGVVPESRKRFASVMVSVKEVAGGGTGHGRHAASGWKPACFYALVVLRAVMKPGSQMEMSLI